MFSDCLFVVCSVNYLLDHVEVFVLGVVTRVSIACQKYGVVVKWCSKMHNMIVHRIAGMFGC